MSEALPHQGDLHEFGWNDFKSSDTTRQKRTRSAAAKINQQPDAEQRRGSDIKLGADVSEQFNTCDLGRVIDTAREQHHFGQRQRHRKQPIHGPRPGRDHDVLGGGVGRF